jgi:hypothetical protein
VNSEYGKTALGNYSFHAQELSSLRRRFRQNQEDVSYTIMALMPTLSKHILEEMDVEGITREIQSISKASRARKNPPISVEPPPESESSLTSSVEVVQVHDHDATSDSGSMLLSSASGHEDTRLSESSTSWVDQLSPGGQQPTAQNVWSPETTSSSVLSYENDEASVVSIIIPPINACLTRLSPSQKHKAQAQGGHQRYPPMRVRQRVQRGSCGRRSKY